MSIVLMGVSGAGKSTLGPLLAQKLDFSFVDGDRLQPESNKKKMAAGMPLDDLDREPWLRAVANVLAGGGVVVACSALKRAYREVLRRAAPEMTFVYLAATPALLAARLALRHHEYMPAGLLASQLDALEPPDLDETSLTVDVSDSPAAVLDVIMAWLYERSVR